MADFNIHGSELISRERSRQVKDLGYSREYDSGNADGLSELAAEQLQKAFDILMVDASNHEDAVEHLKKAGALCAAAIDTIRFDRL